MISNLEFIRSCDKEELAGFWTGLVLGIFMQLGIMPDDELIRLEYNYILNWLDEEYTSNNATTPLN